MKHLFLIELFCLIVLCSKTTDISGTIDETGTGKPIAAVMGLVVYENSQPVSGAAVNLYNRNAVKKIVVPLQKRMQQTVVRNTFTNINGIFRIDSVDTGKYFVDINDHDSLGALVETEVDSTDTVVTVNATLQRLGTIQGKIDTGLVSKSGKTYVYIVEMQRYYEVDSNGTFEVTNIPPYDYTLQVVHDTIVIESSLDTAKIPVVEGDTTHMGNDPPAVLLGVDTISGTAPFTARVIYKVTDPDNDTFAMRLNYGDGSVDTLISSTGSKSHTYTDTGTFTIVLIADDGEGGLGRDSVAVNVQRNNPPKVNITADTTSGSAPLAIKVLYLATDPDGDSVSLRIDYGDGRSDMLIQMPGNRSHTYIDSGTYRLIITAEDGKGGIGTDSVIIAVTLKPASATTLISPVNGATGQPPETVLSWAAVTDATTYHVQVSKDSTFTAVITEDSTLTTVSLTLDRLDNDSTYYWRVRSNNSGGVSVWSSAWSFTTIITAPQIPALSSPANGTAGLPVTTTLSWSTVAGASTYHLQVSTIDDFTSALIEYSTLTTASKAISRLMNNTGYYWRVRAINSGGMSDWTNAWSFTTIVAAPQIPVQLSPVDLAKGISDTTTLSWSPVAGAVTYHVQVATRYSFEGIEIEDSLLTTAFKTLAGLVGDTAYYWRVRAKNAGGVSGWSSERIFGTATVTSPSQTLFFDDFEDGILDSSKWRLSCTNGTGSIPKEVGHSVKEESGALKIIQAKTDYGGRVFTKMITIDTTKKLIISCRTKVHYANTYLKGSNIVLDAVDPVADTVISQLAIAQHLNYTYTGPFIGFGKWGDTLLTPVWDTWFDEKLIYDPRNGVSSYILNNDTLTFKNPVAIQGKGNSIIIDLISNGWYTGHYTWFEWIKVEQ